MRMSFSAVGGGCVQSRFLDESQSLYPQHCRLRYIRPGNVHSTISDRGSAPPQLNRWSGVLSISTCVQRDKLDGWDWLCIAMVVVEHCELNRMGSFKSQGSRCSRTSEKRLLRTFECCANIIVTWCHITKVTWVCGLVSIDAKCSKILNPFRYVLYPPPTTTFGILSLALCNEIRRLALHKLLCHFPSLSVQRISRLSKVYIAHKHTVRPSASYAWSTRSQPNHYQPANHSVITTIIHQRWSIFNYLYVLRLPVNHFRRFFV